MKNNQSNKDIDNIETMYDAIEKSLKLGELKAHITAPISREVQSALDDLEFIISLHPNQIEAEKYIRLLNQTLTKHTLKGMKDD